MASSLCRMCCGLCEDAYLQIHKYVKEMEFVSAEQVSEGANVPVEFVFALIQEGRFGDQGTGSTNQDGCCVRCSKTLKPTESSLCNPCKVLVSHQMNKSGPTPAAVSSGAAPQRAPAASTGKQSRYGLGRK
ncbi:MAG: hypothetical protein KTR14_06575 [Vampirovibrio sp.]|nr:hypothetical protein [Vampirovibrio sp.]